MDRLIVEVTSTLNRLVDDFIAGKTSGISACDVLEARKRIVGLIIASEREWWYETSV